MDTDKKNIFYVVLALVVIVLLGWWILTSKGGMPVDNGSSEAGQAQLAPELQLTDSEKRGDVAEKKAEILVRVNSGTPLTAEEKAEIGGIMLTKANIYQFSEAERQQIFKALSE